MFYSYLKITKKNVYIKNRHLLENVNGFLFFIVAWSIVLHVDVHILWQLLFGAAGSPFLDTNNTDFNTNEQLATAVETLSTNDIALFYKQLIDNKGNSLMVYTNNNKDEKPLEGEYLKPLGSSTFSTFPQD